MGARGYQFAAPTPAAAAAACCKRPLHPASRCRWSHLTIVAASTFRSASDPPGAHQQSCSDAARAQRRHGRGQQQRRRQRPRLLPHLLQPAEQAQHRCEGEQERACEERHGDLVAQLGIAEGEVPLNCSLPCCCRHAGTLRHSVQRQAGARLAARCLLDKSGAMHHA